MIRHATNTDLNRLINLLHQFYIKHNRGQIFTEELAEFERYKNIEEVMQKTAQEYIEKDEYMLFVAEDNKELIGYICGRIREKPHKILHKEGYIEDWFVGQNYRSKGIGKKLFDALIAEFKKLKCTHIATDAYATNHSSIQIYHDLGFIDRYIGLVKKIDA